MKKFLENRLIGTKLGLGFGSVLILALIVGIVGISGVNTLLSRADKVRLSNDLDDTVVEMQRARELYVTSGSAKDKDELLRRTEVLADFLKEGKNLYNGSDVRELVKLTEQNLLEYKKALTNLTDARKNWEAIDDNATKLRRNIFNQYDQTIQQLRQQNDIENMNTALDVANSWYALTSEINDYVIKKENIPTELVTTRFQAIINQTKSLQLSNDLQDKKQTILSLLNGYEELGKSNPTVNAELIRAQKNLMALSADMNDKIDSITLLQEQKSKEDGDQVSTLLITVTAIAILMGIFFAMLIRHMIIKPMNEVMTAVEKISDGDLTQILNTDRKDELGQLYNNIGVMSRTLNKLISEVITGVLNLSSTSEQLEAISKQGQTMMQSQKDETDQVATAINEMSSTVSEVARNAETAAEATTKTDNIVNQGNLKVSDTAKSIESLASDLTVTSKAMEQLKIRTDNVGNVLEVIKAVAEQTNLLALNAAIEAARAGEAGRGFAVVADEVRGLASRTQSSAKEIEDLIVELQNGAQESLDKMLRSRDLSSRNAEQAKEVLELFANISEQVGYVQDMNNQIATAAEEQSQVSDEINRSVENVRQLADRTTEGSIESVAAVSNLRALSHQLKSLTDRFKI
ncbi:HAMP domain-containing methyl-accepting chemotaxis protein [Marinomonas polaris]|uniref:Methyl-accepting chemotaxis protein n=1 Tax=Marinomonas polaris DSM 16579 TaxID=1122206 RepID=A0A1M5KX19_9GAMM|nr:methyl-accepting chemotaxis protein [Marinomonas polaris]SHG56703.1 methyl-accepting chemotaxis protein [Marinomonas polaris DSM 16579]|tara:strand:- start:2175 stop:4073 length:1899 start_codon:yes stop_codon:yes gene_type:complete